MNWAGRRVVIVGGSSGIGLATARALTGRGARVLMASRSREKLDRALQQAGPGAEARTLDVTQEASVEQFFGSIGPFDHLVVSVSISAPGTVLGSTVAQARQAFETKFWGPYMAARCAAKRIGAAGSITLLSAISSRRPVPGATVLAAQNGAIEALVRALAVETAPVRVNAVAPGVIDTPFWEHVNTDTRDALFAATAARVPLRKTGTAEDCAGAIVALMESAYITGAVLDVDGGALLS